MSFDLFDKMGDLYYPKQEELINILKKSIYIDYSLLCELYKKKAKALEDCKEYYKKVLEYCDNNKELDKILRKMCFIKNVKLKQSPIYDEIITSTLKLTVLKYLDQSENELVVLADSISNLKNLTHLDLSNNKLTKLPNNISDLSQLTYLNVLQDKLSSDAFF